MLHLQTDEAPRMSDESGASVFLVSCTIRFRGEKFLSEVHQRVGRSALMQTGSSPNRSVFFH